VLDVSFDDPPAYERLLVMNNDFNDFQSTQAWLFVYIPPG
jgi:hypothetical protein